MKNNQQITLFQPPEPDDTLPFELDDEEMKLYMDYVYRTKEEIKQILIDNSRTLMNHDKR